MKSLGRLGHLGNLGRGSRKDIIPFVSDLTFWSKQRNGLSLVDIYGNNASILMPYLNAKTQSGGTQDPGCYSGVDLVANTIWVVKLRDVEGNGLGSLTTDNGGMSIGAGYKNSAYRYSFKWGDAKTFNTNASLVAWAATTDKVFIIYAGKFWVLDKDTALTDASITNIINNVTPDFTSSGTFTASNKQVYYAQRPGGTATEKAFWYSSYFGTVTAGVITWQAKHVFNNPYYVYDLLGNHHLPYFGASKNGIIEYSANGDKSCLTIGHTTCLKAGSKMLSLPYINGVADTLATLYTGYVRSLNSPAITDKHNLADSMIEFTGTLFDRSSTTIYEDAARAATTYYDSLNPRRWHISEINRLLLDSWLKTDYKGRWFPHVSPNSVDEEERLYLDEIFSYGSNKSGNDLNRVLKYNNDYNLIVL
jgi:hypothetical protein